MGQVTGLAAAEVRAMIEQPHLNRYSVHALICLGIAAFGAALFVAALFMGMR